MSRAIAGTDGNPRVARPQITSLRRDANTPVERPTRPQPVPRPLPPLPTTPVVVEAPSEEEWRALDAHLADQEAHYEAAGNALLAGDPPPATPPPTVHDHPAAAAYLERTDEALADERTRVARRAFDRGATVTAIAADLGLRPMGVHNLLAGRPVSAPP